MNVLQRRLELLSMATLSITLLGCGGDGGTGPDPDEDTVLPGIFLDAFVSGLTYQSGDNPPGQTGQAGSFEYVQGAPITFSMGGVELGTLNRGSPVITPYDFPVPENIARFIQSFDDDQDPSNGISLLGPAQSLSGVSVPSSVFANPDRTAFETDPALVNALQLSGRILIDATTALNNLQSGTDNTFAVSELAGQVFAFSLGTLNYDGAGWILFHALASPGARGSTGEFTFSEDGSTATGEDVGWDVSTSGVLTLDPVDSGDPSLVLTKAGGTDRVISATLAEAGDQPEPVTLFRPLPLTETDVAGAPTTQNGIASKTYRLFYSIGGLREVTFTADGTFSWVEPDGIVDGTWIVNGLVEDVILMIPAHAQDDWRAMMFLDGDLGRSGEAFVAKATLTGGSIDDPELSFTKFSFPNFQRWN